MSKSASNDKTNFCHTEGEARSVPKEIQNRDISAFSKPQYDNASTRDISVASLPQYDNVKNAQYKKHSVIASEAIAERGNPLELLVANF